MKALFKLSSLLALAALLIVSCIQDPLVEEPVVSSIQVTVSAGIASEPSTKSEVAIENGARVLKFTEGDRLYILLHSDVKKMLCPGADYIAGFLSMVGSPSADGKSASFTGTLQGYDQEDNTYFDYQFYPIDGDPLEGSKATLVHAGLSETGYSIDNVKGEISFTKKAAPDADSFMTSCLYVTSDYDINTKSYSLSGRGPIFNCIITGLTASHSYYYNLGYDVTGGFLVVSKGNNITTDAYGTAQFAFSSNDLTTNHWKLQLKEGNALIATIDLGERAFEKKVYNILRKWTGTAFVAATNLADINSDYTAQNGEILTGTLGRNVKISIDNGAVVVLHNVSINANGTWADAEHAGITCLGDATIILSGTNTVRGFNSKYPGLQAGPAGAPLAENTTLTIQGTGSLTASCNSSVEANGYGAGIGAGLGISCGNIEIAGGSITATAGNHNAAGIGTGGDVSRCGNITISGGTVVATGSYYGPGIGAGDQDCSCGNITVGAGITRVTAIRGSLTHDVDITVSGDTDAPCIGTMGSGYCLDVNFGTQLMCHGYNWNPWPVSGSDYGGLHFVISKTNKDRDTWTLTPATAVSVP